MGLEEEMQRTTRPMKGQKTDGFDATLGKIIPKPFPSYRPAIAVRATGNCRSGYRQLPFELPAIAIRSAGNCHSPTDQGTLRNFPPFPLLSTPPNRPFPQRAKHAINDKFHSYAVAKPLADMAHHSPQRKH